MRKLILLFVVVLFGIFSFKQTSDSDKLNEIIKKYEAKREYEFKRNESVENTIKYHQAEADFAKEIIEKLEKVSVEGLSETEKISRELLLFVLQDEIDSNNYKTYLNTITNENAFHLNLARIGNRTLENKKQVVDYLKRLDSLPQGIGYNINLLRASINVISYPAFSRGCPPIAFQAAFLSANSAFEIFLPLKDPLTGLASPFLRKVLPIPLV